VLAREGAVAQRNHSTEQDASLWRAYATMIVMPHDSLFMPAASTLISFLVALLFFLSEAFVFKTVSLKCATSPFVVASEWPRMLHQVLHWVSRLARLKGRFHPEWMLSTRCHVATTMSSFALRRQVSLLCG
jgi:hypothetical protein